MTRPTPKEIQRHRRRRRRAGERRCGRPHRQFDRSRASRALPRSPARCRSIWSRRPSSSCSPPARPIRPPKRPRHEPAARPDVADSRSRRRSREKHLSSREATQSCLDRIAQWQPRLNAFMAIEAEAALAAADAADAALAKGELSRAAAWRAAGAQGHVLRGRTGLSPAARRSAAISSPSMTSTALQRLKDAGTVRLGIAADGGVRLWADRPQCTLRAGAQSMGPRSHHRRLVVGIGRGGRRAAELCGPGLGHRRLDPDAGAFLRRYRIEDHRRADQPRRRDAVVAVARHRRAAGAQRRGLRAAARPDGGRRPRGSDRGRRAAAGLSSRRRASRSRAWPSAFPAAFYVDDLDPEVARILDDTIAVLRREGANIVEVDLPDQRQLRPRASWFSRSKRPRSTSDG